MKNYKIKVNNEADSKEAQELFFELGYYCNTGLGVNNLGAKFLYVKNSKITMGFCSGNFSDSNHCELTLPQLRDFVVLHRNDVKDANYTCSGKPVLKLDTQDYKVWDPKNNTWTEHVGSQTDLRKGIKPIQPEQCLISGADALRALADGKEVEYSFVGEWFVVGLKTELGIFHRADVAFRLKPQTITLSLEIPAPFEPKGGETAYFLSTSNSCGYTYTDEFKGYGFDSLIQFGAWRTEEEIKQVVAALRVGVRNEHDV